MNGLSEIKIEITESIEGLSCLKSVWTGLTNQMPNATIFQTYGWNYTWWLAYGSDHRLFILTIAFGDETIGIAPLMITGETVEFIGTPNADYSDFITDRPELCIKAIVDYLKKNQDKWKQVDLSQIPEKSPTINTLKQELEKAGLNHRTCPIENVMSYRYNGDGDNRDNFKMRRGGTIRKFMNFFNKMDGLSLHCFDSADEIRSRLPEFYHSHIVWWFKRGGNGCKFINPNVRDFHDLAAKHLAGQSLVRLYILTHGAQPLAYLYAFIYEKTIYLYQIASLMNYRKKSPGVILLHMLIDSAIREGFDVIDFSRGGGGHKERFANQSGRNMQCAVYASGLKKSLAAIYSGLKGSSAGLKLKSIYSVRKLKNSVGGTSANDFSDIASRTVSLIFAAQKDETEFDYYAADVEEFQSGESSEIAQFKELIIDDINNIAAFCGIENDSDDYAEFERRFKTDGKCFAAEIDGHQAAIGWILTNPHMMPKNVRDKLNGRRVYLLADIGISPVFYSTSIASSFYHMLGSACRGSGDSIVTPCGRTDSELGAILADLKFEHMQI